MKLERKKWKMLKKRGRSLLATQLWNFVREKGGKESLPSQSREFMLFTWRTINHPGDKPRLALPLQNYQCVFSERNPLHTAGCSLQRLPSAAWGIHPLSACWRYPPSFLNYWARMPHRLWFFWFLPEFPGWNATTAMASSLWPLTIGLWSEVAQSCPTLCDPMDCRLPGSSVHGII